MSYAAPVDLPTSSLFRLDGRTILISGGAGAVGATVGKAILESGGDVVFVDLPEHPNLELWETIHKLALSYNTKATYHQLNVTEVDSVKPLFKKISSELRYPLRGLVACAGISGEADAVDYPIDVFRKIVDVNVTGTMVVCQEVAREMHRIGVTGSMVIIASISGWVSNRGLNTAAYNASKSALHQLSRSLAAEWGHPQNTFPGSTNPDFDKPRETYPPIRVNTLSPGHIQTPIAHAAASRGLAEKWADQNMLGRISQKEEYRAPCLFLLGDGSSYMTGADLRVDGGHCAW